MLHFDRKPQSEAGEQEGQEAAPVNRAAAEKRLKEKVRGGALLRWQPAGAATCRRRIQLPARPRPPQRRLPTPVLRSCVVAVLLQMEAKAKEEEEEPYVYLPPGSSMREPLYHNSMSDPTDKTVYWRDPTPKLKK